MAVTQNLLTKTLRWYIVFAVIILLVTAPIFYFVTQRLYIDEANETLKLHKKEFVRYHLPTLKLDSIDTWNRYNRDEKILPRHPKHRKDKKDKFSTVFHFDELSHENEPYRVITSPIIIEGKPFTYTSKINLVEREDMMKSVAYLFLGLISAMLIGLYFITKVMSVRLWRPFYNALDHLEKFEVDKVTKTNLSQTTINEFARLNQAIEGLIQKNTSIYNVQKEFIENAAHELQTPLAVIQGKLEALFQQSSLTQSQSEVLEKLNESVSRLARLNKNLLLLSRIEHDQFSTSEQLSINALLKKHFEFFAEQAAAKNIRITLNENTEVSVNTNPVLAEVLLNNLMFNAIRHNLPSGTIVINLEERHLSISNSGTSTALPQEKIFDRFSKINPSTQGSGLGLAIIKKIVDLNRWAIHYHFKNDLHTFTIAF
ncbi:MAG TPA: HAMP domain-containing sensor histidine kinase [Cyclobacteriaceae bacterium]|nr:HAMP domain-containing sensor histidine kinase [Cyclobacteriaceae bacterium]